MSLRKHIDVIVNQVFVPGSLFWRRERRVLLRRWKRAMLLPETVLLAGLVIFSAVAMDHTPYRPGQAAQAAAHNIAQDGMAAMPDKRKQRVLQSRLSERPENLMRLTGQEAVSAFSYADLQRQEGDIVMLQFRGNQCVLDIFFHDGGKSTAHYEFRPREIAAVNRDAGHSKIRLRECVSDILKSRRV